MNDSKDWKASHVTRLEALMKRSVALRGRQVVDGALTPGQMMISDWQTQRLETTYYDLVALKRYRPAVEFFQTDLYGARDFSQRDTDFERIYPLMVRFLSDGALMSVTIALELQTLSQELDLEMIDVLTGRLGVDPVGGAAVMTPELYAEAYRVLGNHKARIRQIELAYRAGEILDEVVGRKMIYQTVRLARKPAQVAGLGTLQDFIERGLRAFRNLKGAKVFLDTIRTRETFILEQIFAGEPASTWYGSDIFEPIKK